MGIHRIRPRAPRRLALAPLVLLFTLAGRAPAQEAAEPAFEWDRRAVEHVWNRAGFGIAEDEIERWVAAGPEALVDHLLAPRPLEGQSPFPPFVFEGPRVPTPEEARALSDEDRRRVRDEQREANNRGFEEFREHWMARVLSGEDPLRDRMTLFWHGVFTTSYIDVRHPRAMSRQHETLRTGALASYAELLRAMLRDPAMLVYLDNNQNRKERPNENLAREAMELFSLGEGNYTEDDVHEAARALTGAGIADPGNGGRYRFARRQHDDGVKRILGVEGQLGPDDLPTILLTQPACARFIAGSILEYLEGLTPDAERLERYAELLRSSGYAIAPLVRTLLFDPHFYSPDVIGARIASPVDYLVGFCVRSGAEVPPRALLDAADALGQDMFRPPSVKGWDEGLAWISTSTFMLRGNIAGALLGQINPTKMRSDAQSFAEEMGSSGMMEDGGGSESLDGETKSPDALRRMSRQQLRRDELAQIVQGLAERGYRPSLSFNGELRRAGAETDRAVVEALARRLLAITPPDETLAMLAARLAEARAALELDEADFLKARPQRIEPILRRLAYLVLSLPEAQLH